MLYTCLASLHFPALHLINIYLPPGYCNFSSAQQNTFWLDISQLLTTLPSSEPLLIVGNFNAHLGDSFYSLHPLCPCHGAKCIPLQGTTSGPTAARGGQLAHLLSTHPDLHVLNGCPNLLPYTH